MKSDTTKQPLKDSKGQSFEDFLKEHPYKDTRSFTKEDWESSMYEKWKDSKEGLHTTYTAEEPQFSGQELFDENIPPLLKWIADGEIDGLIDEDCGGFIGYINKAHIERVCQSLNERKALLDSQKELEDFLNDLLREKSKTDEEFDAAQGFFWKDKIRHLIGM